MMPSPASCVWRQPAAQAAKAAGYHARAAAFADAEIAVAQTYGMPAYVGAALHTRYLISDKPDETDLVQAIELLEGTGLRLQLAKALLTRGRTLRQAGQRIESRRPLRRAQEIAHACGARTVEQHAREELLATGLRPRRPADHGVGSLTPTERRIATLAGEGLTNRQIAERLFVSKHTVEWHLRHIHDKLMTSSRADLCEQINQTTESPAGH